MADSFPQIVRNVRAALDRDGPDGPDGTVLLLHPRPEKLARELAVALPEMTVRVVAKAMTLKPAWKRLARPGKVKVRRRADG